MNKLVMFFLLAYFFGMLCAAIGDGTAGPSATYLTANLTDVGTTMTVRSTNGFDKVGTVTVDTEEINYNGKTSTQLLNLSRGKNDTTSSAHVVRAKVYDEGTNILNAALGFNVAKVQGSGGILAIPLWGYNLAFKTFPHLVTWDFNFLKEAELQYFRYFLLVCSAAFIIWLVYQMIWVMSWVAQKFF